MRIALFGGSFNPPHLGHKAVIKDLLSSHQFDEIWILPCYHHPFEKELLPFEDRLEMARLTFDDLGEKVKISTLEKETDSPKGYTVDLIRYLLNHYPEHSFSWVIGTDLFQEKEKWKDFEEIEKKVSIYKIPRAGYEHSHYPKISSSEIRQSIKQNKNIKIFLTGRVADLIDEKGWYQ